MLVEDEGLKSPIPLTDGECRVLGVLIEKSLTTPDAYPMTLNGLVSGCNQKSNRDPVVSYEPEDVEEFLDGLRGKDLCNEVHTAGGRTEKFRHVSRIKFGWGEIHVAIMGELLLRGRQQIGELRSRAGRMREIASLDVLRHALTELKEAGFVHASGPLDRRGIEVDHWLGSEPLKDASYEPQADSTDDFTTTRPDAISELKADVAALRREITRLQDAVFGEKRS